jgi:glycosyltransferase involved in cell wall biosynthesis
MSDNHHHDLHTETTAGGVQPFGVVAMAAYRPNAELFRRQVESIRNQTHRNFVCLISADGDSATLASELEGIVGQDPRFNVLGFDERLGFYRNFERVLKNVPLTAEWVALSDQDDNWYPNKLERLVSQLSAYPLVTSQARVVEYPSGLVLSERTQRRNVRPQSYFVENQYTGGAMAFRRDVLDLALPFPKFDSPSEVHDHWIAVCASAKGQCLVLDDVLQDYVQHGENVLGEAKSGFSLWRSYRNLMDIVQERYRTSSPRAVLRTIYDVGAGWREVMADQLGERAGELHGDIGIAVGIFGSQRHRMRTYRAIFDGWSSGEITVRAALEYFLGDAPASLGSLVSPLSDKVDRASRPGTRIKD